MNKTFAKDYFLTLLIDLADWARTTLGRGIHLDADLLACLESTFGTPDPEVLLADA